MPLAFPRSVLILKNNKPIEKPESVTTGVCCIFIQKYVVFKGDDFVLVQNSEVSFKRTVVPLFK